MTPKLLMPREPTEAMIEAAMNYLPVGVQLNYRCDVLLRRVYRAMVARYEADAENSEINHD